MSSKKMEVLTMYTTPFTSKYLEVKIPLKDTIMNAFEQSEEYVNKGREIMKIIIKAIFFIISAFLFVIITHGFLAVICCKNKREKWNEAFWAALTLDETSPNFV